MINDKSRAVVWLINKLFGNVLFLRWLVLWLPACLLCRGGLSTGFVSELHVASKFTYLC